MPRHAVALAGIMGGENTEVTPDTTNILLESAHFDRTSVRKTARANGLSTESSYRFERIVDPAGVVRAADRAAQLMVEWSGGIVAAGVIDVAQPMPLTRVIAMRPDRVNAVLGAQISRDDMLAVLRGLELTFREEGDIVSVTSPRSDLISSKRWILSKKWRASMGTSISRPPCPGTSPVPGVGAGVAFTRARARFTDRPPDSSRRLLQPDRLSAVGPDAVAG